MPQLVDKLEAIFCCYIIGHGNPERRHNILHNDTLHSDTQQNATLWKMISIVATKSTTLAVTFSWESITLSDTIKFTSLIVITVNVIMLIVMEPVEINAPRVW